MLGEIMLENYEREDAFGESEVRLLSTVAASMGVALENARLFDETQRLLKETEQRAAELAVINSIQQGMAGVAEFPGHRRPGRRQAARSTRHGRHRHPPGATPRPGWSTTCTNTSTARRLQVAPAIPAPGGPSDQMRETLAPVVFNTCAEMQASGVGVVPGTDIALSVIFVPIVSGDRMTRRRCCSRTTSANMRSATRRSGC